MSLKCVLVGDNGVGKTSLLIVFEKNVFPQEYVPTVFDQFVKSVDYDGNKIQLKLEDTSVGESYSIRPCNYQGANIVMISFSFDDLLSFENVTKKWVPEIQHYLPNVPRILVGNKVDLKDGSKITEKQVEKCIKENKFSAYCETSAKINQGVNEVFDKVIGVALNQKDKSNQCIIN